MNQLTPFLRSTYRHVEQDFILLQLSDPARGANHHTNVKVFNCFLSGSAGPFGPAPALSAHLKTAVTSADHTNFFCGASSAIRLKVLHPFKTAQLFGPPGLVPPRSVRRHPKPDHIERLPVGSPFALQQSRSLVVSQRPG
ncbi:hypothetical protein [Bradyrhizobium arachidis]|uniref:hypothetical protein n=1 Tax=Bradyrhizobium arachidis TaxID=858423 RepID=UPI002163A2EF|nr:hypothetical protein [Bradyrhizobium arachidis]UVO28138.1 hypothetical protein KUF59_37650 [Bradyrhizobium arachidis]